MYELIIIFAVQFILLPFQMLSMDKRPEASRFVTLLILAVTLAYLIYLLFFLRTAHL